MVVAPAAEVVDSEEAEQAEQGWVDQAVSAGLDSEEEAQANTLPLRLLFSKY